MILSGYSNTFKILRKYTFDITSTFIKKLNVMRLGIEDPIKARFSETFGFFHSIIYYGSDTD